MFSNIELPLGYNIMTSEHVLHRTWREIAKKQVFWQQTCHFADWHSNVKHKNCTFSPYTAKLEVFYLGRRPIQIRGGNGFHHEVIL